MSLPRWIEPQLCKLATKAPSGPQWAHEIKLDGYRMAARIEGGRVKLLTRSGLDWTAKYPTTAAAFAKLKVRTAYLDGELCGVRPDGVTSFELMQQGGEGLTYFAFDLLELDGEDIARLPLLERKKTLAALLRRPPVGIAYSEHESCDGEVFRRAACGHGLEGIVSKRIDRRICPATEECGSRRSASTGPSLSSWDGRTPKDRGLMSEPSCSVTSSRMVS
jgi:bifunctional non-homologous end joining protein LigD